MLTGSSAQPIHRLGDWPAILRAEIERARHMPFAWGTHDCCAWARRVVTALRGVDPAAHLVFDYSTELGAAKMLARYGGMERLVTELLGPPIAPSYAQRGDVVLADWPNGPSLGISVGNALAFVGWQANADEQAGLVFVDPMTARLAWRV